VKTLRGIALFCGLLFCAVFQAQATLLELSVTYPTIDADNIAVSYTALSNAFAATGEAYFYTVDESTYHDIWDEYYNVGSFSLDATVSNTGQLIAGTLTISGGLDYGPSMTLLTGDLTALGYQDPGDPNNDLFDWLFQVTGGALASDYGGIGATGGINLDAEFGSAPNPFTGDWSFDYDNGAGQNGIAQVFPVPEPSSFLLLLVGGVLCAGACRMRSK
jgi:hypothetical protein